MSLSGLFKDLGKAFNGFQNNTSNQTDLKTLLADISSVLDPQESEVVIVHGKGCEVVFTNKKANDRLRAEEAYPINCNSSFAKHFPGICDHCPYSAAGKAVEVESFEIVSSDKRTYLGRCNKINWVDGKPAVIYVLRDITSERETRERLYSLAYIDQLTGIPNRLKLKENFAALEHKIENNMLSGVIALFDLDHFKAVNDTYGHNTGDVILRRLTGHLEAESMFSGHLYRLGGDEFVFLFYDPPGKFNSEDEAIAHYTEILTKALRDYTLPNIDVKCTLSIGVSMFPKHGNNLSEVLRKADIALYQAKADGRNRIVFFKEQYDSAQKFKDMYINIQPILVGVGNTFGYELADSWSKGEEDEKTVHLKEFNHTLDALGLNDIESTFHYFISYSKQLLNPAVLKNLPRDKFIVQFSIPANIKKDELKENLRNYLDLRKNGYQLALTRINSSAPVQELIDFADYCKFSSSDKNLILQKKIIASNPKVKFIATKVDTIQAFQEAKNAGFHMFQGYYFNQPVPSQKTKEISPLKLNYFRLMKLSSTDDYMDFREISSIISSDVALSYKLLRILNSAAVGLRNVSSISNAVAYMGEESLKKWIAVLALRGIAEDKPLELVRMSLVRARFGELLAPKLRIKRNPQLVFMVGMLSLLHIALEKTKEQMLEEIPLSTEIRDSFLTKTGVYSDILQFYENYEYSNWELVSQFVYANGLDSSFVNDAYIESVKWYYDLEK